MILMMSIDRVHVEETGDLIIRHVLATDEGKYQCVAHNMAATRESPAVSLSVYGTSIVNTSSVLVILPVRNLAQTSFHFDYWEVCPAFSKWAFVCWLPHVDNFNRRRHVRQRRG